MTGLRGFFLADPEQLSLLALVDQLVSGEASGHRFYRIEGGNDQLSSRLVARLQQPVLYRTTLEAVSQSSDRVTATLGCEDGSYTQMPADYLVAAIPAATLHDVQFQPTLPEPQRKALAHLPFGRATKALLQFDQRFWSKHGRPKAYGTTLPIGALWDGNEEQRGEAGILTLLAGGSASDQTRDRIATHGLGGILETLAWLGSSGARLLNSRIISWEDDRWARGGYAYFPPAFDPTWRSWLSRPHGRVFFAGEHTSQRWQGYMNGAVESGLRAAAEIQAAAWLEKRR